MVLISFFSPLSQLTLIPTTSSTSFVLNSHHSLLKLGFNWARRLSFIYLSLRYKLLVSVSGCSWVVFWRRRRGPRRDGAADSLSLHSFFFKLFYLFYFPPRGCTLSFITLFSLWHWLSNSIGNRTGWLWPTVAETKPKTQQTFILLTHIYILCNYKNIIFCESFFFLNVTGSM